MKIIFKKLAYLLFILFWMNTTVFSRDISEIKRKFDTQLSELEEDKITENTIIAARIDVRTLGCDLEPLVWSLAVLYKSKRIDYNLLELGWWRAFGSDVRKLYLLLYYEKYGFRPIDVYPDFRENSARFEKGEANERIREIEEVMHFLKAK